MGGHLDNPGPGAYIGLHESDRIMQKKPSWTMGPSLRYPMPELGPSPYEKAMAMRNAEMEKRLKRSNAGHGEITISLMWNRAAEWDLHVVIPSPWHDTSAPSSKAHAVQNMIPTATLPTPWCPKRAFRVASLGDEDVFEEKAMLLDPQKYGTIAKAVNDLNKGFVDVAPYDFAVVRAERPGHQLKMSSCEASYFVLYKKNMEDQAFHTFNMPREISFENPWMLAATWISADALSLALRASIEWKTSTGQM